MDVKVRPREAVQLYKTMDISLEDFSAILHPLVKVDFESPTKSIEEEGNLSDLYSTVEPSDVRAVLEKYVRGMVEEVDLANWARVLRMSSLYSFYPPNEDLLAEVVFLLSSPSTHGAPTVENVTYLLQCLDSDTLPDEDHFAV
jgi:hypothetical protein